MTRDALRQLLTDEALCAAEEAFNQSLMNEDTPEGKVLPTAAEAMRQVLLAALTPAGEKKPDVRAIVEAVGFDPTNHHNAAKCPYCVPDVKSLIAAVMPAREMQDDELPTCGGCLGRSGNQLRDGLCATCWPKYPALRIPS